MTHDVEGLDADGVLRAASERAGGLEDLGDGPFVEPLGRFVESLAADGRLNDIGRLISNERMLLHTVNRLNYVNDRKRFPEIAAQKIVRPVFIIGMPRTGTTILHDILACDPRSRAPMTWEVMFPSPPPQTATFDTDPRIAQCAATFPGRDLQLPGFDAIHPMGAQLTQECVVMMGETMCTPLFHNQFRVPTYEDWIDDEADWEKHAEEITREVKAANAAIGFATVYRTIKLLTEAGLARGMSIGDRCSRYEPPSQRGHHDHLICRACGRIGEFENDRIESLQEKVAYQHGFTVTDHKLELYGLCGACRTGGG